MDLVWKKKKKVVSFCHARWECSVIALIHLYYWVFRNTFHFSFAYSFRDICTKREAFSAKKVLSYEMPVKVVACVVHPSIDALLFHPFPI